MANQDPIIIQSSPTSKRRDKRDDLFLWIEGIDLPCLLRHWIDSDSDVTTCAVQFIEDCTSLCDSDLIGLGLPLNQSVTTTVWDIQLMHEAPFG
jgi:hypothetical protein